MESQPNAPETMSELRQRIDESWSSLEQTLSGLTDEQLTTVKDQAGWTVKDHLVHLTAWESSITNLILGQPRHEALGVDQAIYLEGPIDTINAIIQDREQDRPLPEILDELHHGHQQLLGALATLDDDDLRRPPAHFLPDDPGVDAGDTRPVLEGIAGNSYEHYDEHHAWIREMMR